MLVVEDSHVAQRLIEVKLAKLGCDVTLSSDGESARRRLRVEHFDLVVMDRELPDWDGCELTLVLRTLPGPSQRTPVIGLSATTTDAAREECRAAGMLSLLAKPLVADDLVRLVKTLHLLRPRSPPGEHHVKPGAPPR